MSKFNLDGQDAIKTIRTLIAEVENLKTSMKNINKANASSFDTLEAGLKSTRDKVGLLTNKLNHLEAILKKNASANNADSKATDKNASSKKNLKKQVEEATKSLNKQEKEVKKSSKGFAALSSSVGNLIKAFGIIKGAQMFIDISKNIYENIKTFDSLNFAMEKITKTTQNYENSQRFIIQLTKDFGVELVPTTERWIKFLAAAEQSGLSLKSTEDIFRSMTKAASVLGLQTDEMTQVYLALEQMLSKGKITTEELRRQLGERLPGAMGIMAASMGKTIPELDKMMKLGQVLSAEVLPDFAKAVEVAYGIENVDRVETITAAQNRLSAAWQSFVKSISEGDSIIKSVLNGIINGLTYIAEAFEYLAQNEEQRLRFRIAREEEAFRKSMEIDAQNLAAQQAGFKNRLDLIEQYENAKAKLQDAGNQKEKDEAQKLFDELSKIRVEVGKAANEAMVKDAAATLDDTKKMLEEARDVYDEFMEEMQKPARNIVASSGTQIGSTPPGGFRNLTKFGDEDEESLRAAVVIYESMYNVLRKIVQISDVNIINDEELKITQRELRIVKDLFLEIQEAISQQVKSGLEEQLKDEKKSIEERIELINKINDQEVFLARTALAIKQRDIEDSFKKEKESLEQSVNNGRLSREKYNEFIVKAEKEKNQKLEIAAIELQTKLDDIQSKSSGSLNKVSDDADAIGIDIIQDKYNKEIAKIKETYELSKKTNEDKEQMEKSLRDVSVQMANEIINAKIAILEASIKGASADEEWVQQVIRDINDLKAALEVVVPDENADKDAWVKYWDFILDYAREAVSAIGDIVDGVFESRIENINAEIQAEKDKYDALITLARDDDEERQTLERNKDARIKQLEKKRLKEEQKQARARKAFAIADIGIKTAQAIMGIWADFPKFDFGISAGVATALVSALGAAQIASVLAQPIPKYKDGTTVDKKHVGMINDGMWQEYVQRGGDILTTKTKDAIVGLQPGDIVYKNYDDMARKSSVFNSIVGGQYISQNDFNRYFLGMESAISRGFKNVKINNKNQISLSSNNNGYKEQMSYW